MQNGYRIGLIGLGRLGKIVTARLAKHHQLVIYDRNPELVSSIAQLYGISAAGSLDEVARCNMVLLALPDREIINCIQQLNSFKREMLVINMATNMAQSVAEQAAIRPVRCTSVKFVGHAGEMSLGFNPVIIVNQYPEDQVQAVSLLFQPVGHVIVGQADMVTAINTIAAEKAVEAGVLIEETLKAEGYNDPVMIQSAISQVGAGILKAYANNDLGPFAQEVAQKVKMKKEV